jgi:DNA (cytosine-5)-methyltransferase 1
LETVNELALFAGAGGGILGGKLLGWRTVCAVERDAYAAQVLAQRQNDGALEPFPIWSDVCSFDGRPWRGIVDVVSGGFPCQDISAAGKGAGIDGKRSGLWVQMARIIREVRPRFIFVENSPMLTSRGLGRVLGDLAALGYDAQWTVLSAADVGAPHIRERIWILANARSRRCDREDEGKMEQSRRTEIKRSGFAADTNGDQCAPRTEQQSRRNEAEPGWETSSPAMSHRWWAVEPDVGRVAHGVAHRVDRLRAIGNGQVPMCAATAWKILKGL